jgi:putative hydrolase of HD superfamily
MEKKFELISDLLTALSVHPLLATYLEINHLKQLYRQGWLRVGISREQCESVADHIYAMSMLVWLVADAGLAPGVDRDKALRMVLAHELGEIYTGDIVPGDHVPLEEKQRLERNALRRVAGKLQFGQEFVDLWEEFEAGDSPESRLVRQLDRLEMALQALVYEKHGYQNMDSFYRSAGEAVRSPELTKLMEIVQSLR